jgi:transposase
MRRAPVITLSIEERIILERTVRSTRSAVRDVFRARILLLAAEGQANHQIAATLSTAQDTVSKWRRRFAAHRCEGLKDEPGRGRKRQYTEQAIEHIVAQTLYRTPGHATHWSTRTMAEHVGMSHTTVSRIWNAHELKAHLVRTFKLSRDKQFIDKLRDVIGLYLNPPEHALVYCVDEKSHRPSTAPSPVCR